MAIFEYCCHPCEIFWEKEYDVGKAKSKTKCPSCGKMGERYWGNTNINLSFGSDVDFHSVRSRTRRNRIKTSSDDGKRFYEEAITNSKKRLQEGGQAYARYTMNPEVLLKEGRIQTVGRKDQETNNRAAGKVVENARKRAWKK